MFSWLRRSTASQDTVALYASAAGVAGAAVRHRPGQPPVLSWAAWQGAERASAADVEALLHAHDAGDGKVVSVMPPGAYNLLQLEAPDVPTAELRDAVRWRVKDLLDFPVEDAIVDVFPLPPHKGGRDNMVSAVVARKSAVQEVIDPLLEADVEVSTVDIPELALRNIARLVPEDVGGVALIHLDEQSGLITITRQGTLYLSRRFEGGRARLLAGGATEVSAEMEGLLDAIVIEIQRSLDYYESQFSQPSVQGVVIAPLGRELAGIDDYLSSQLGLPVRVLAIRELLDCDSGLDTADEARCLMALGCALREAETAA